MAACNAMKGKERERIRSIECTYKWQECSVPDYYHDGSLWRQAWQGTYDQYKYDVYGDDMLYRVYVGVSNLAPRNKRLPTKQQRTCQKSRIITLWLSTEGNTLHTAFTSMAPSCMLTSSSGTRDSSSCSGRKNAGKDPARMKNCCRSRHALPNDCSYLSSAWRILVERVCDHSEPRGTI